MTVAGIVCEYNPLHLGHAAQIQLVRETLGPDCAVVCVMSGNFVQRGEPALCGKGARAEMALRAGADLVVELPVPWAAASAERFAAGGVALLEALGAEVLVFGSECGDAERLRRLAGALLTPEAGELVRRELAEGLSYAAARERAAEALLGEDAGLLREPNNILGVEYLKAVLTRGAGMRPLTFRRLGPGHDGGEAEGFASGSRIRELVRQGGGWARFMPDSAADILRRELAAGRAPVSMEALEPMVMYRLRTMSDAEYEALPDGGEGLWLRLARCGRREATLRGVLEAAKTKRYALARLRRMVLAAALGVTGEDQRGDPPYIRVLALNQRGRGVLREAKGRAALPILTKPAAARELSERARHIFELEARAGDLYALGAPEPDCREGGGEWMMTPLVL